MSVKTDLVVQVRAAESVASENQQGVINHIVEVLSTIENSSADVVFSDRRSLSASASEVLDLAGSLSGALGNTLTFARGKLVLIRNRNSTDGDDLNVGPDSTNGWVGMVADASDRIKVPAGGFLLWYDPNGQAVTAGSADELYIAEIGGANAVSYDIVILGKSS